LPQKVAVTRFSTEGRFRRGLMDRGGESCKGVAAVAEVTIGLTMEIVTVTANLLLPSQYCGS